MSHVLKRRSVLSIVGQGDVTLSLGEVRVNLV